MSTYIASLEDRIRLLQGPGYIPGISEVNRFSKPDNPPHTPQPNEQVSSAGAADSSPSRIALSLTHHRPLHGLGASVGTPEHTRPFQSPATHTARRQSQSNAQDTDGVSAMMGAMEEDRSSQEFFGSSSAASFMRQIKTAVDRRVSSPNQSTPDSASLGPERSSFMPNEKERQSAIHDYVLPPRRISDSLMGVYWDYVFPLYPFVDSIRLREEYARIWMGDSIQSDESMLMCTFNVIFALSCQLADFIVPEERENAASAFFSRAKELLHFNLWDSGSATLIQCLLLMAQYLQSTNSAHQCWIITGFAVRNAQSMGLHLPQTSACLQSPQEQQLARKIWHGCVLMDRIISMTFGRPAMISKASYASVPLPATIDEEYIASASGTEVAQPGGQPSIMAFYTKSLELYEIMNDVLLSLYTPVPEESFDDAYNFYFNGKATGGELTIFELDRALTRWCRSLPSHLRGEIASVSGSAVFYRQSVVLRARFLHVRMLLFRPILSRYCTVRDTAPDSILLSDSFPQRVALQCSVICVNVAREIIALIHGNAPVDGTAGPLPAWWYNILYVYTAATVIIASRLCPAIMEEVTEFAVTHSWNCALEILRKYQSYSTSARRCVAALEILYERAASEGSEKPEAQTSMPMANTMGDLYFGEGMNSGLLDGFDLPDFQDMSWLNSVPSHLY
ncbi:transcription factor domain-containing protein [Aspergillus undulatus]|uniref:transcription factor domain-containing protein n=1 Tax=Aspergillus undulatus TaxID=1810928 RepID=UPI003CCCE66B